MAASRAAARPAPEGRMLHRFEDPVSGGRLHLLVDATAAELAGAARDPHPFYTIAWNAGDAQRAVIDGLPVGVPAGAVVPLVSGQAFGFERASGLVLWRFDRPFYCILDHDAEVSCAGLLFYGASATLVLPATPDEHAVVGALLGVFVDELRTRDAMQGEMLRMLLKRLIIRLTRLARAHSVPASLDGAELDLVRRFNVLVEQHFRTHRRVADYAAMLHRTPKTLSNLFARHGQPAPSRIIQARVALEARRLLHWTDRPLKQVADDLGFADVATFGRFFRAETGETPAAFRRGAGTAGNPADIAGNPALGGAAVAS